MSQALEKVIAAFAAVNASDKEWRGKCPVCGHNALLISSGDKQPVMAWCSAGCDKKAVNAAVYRASGIEAAPLQPFTVARFCEMKKLPESWVRQFLVHDSYFWSKKKRRYSTTPSVCFSYFSDATVTRNGNRETLERFCGGLKFRFSEDSHKTAWQHYTKAMLYGLHMLPYYAENFIDTSVVTLCEGESDTITLAYNRICAFGIPGAPYGWNNEFAKEQVLHNAARILVIQEPDDAGAKMVAKIAACFPAGKVCRLVLPKKDPSELWIENSDGTAFRDAWDAAVKSAQPVVDPVTNAVVDRPDKTIEEDPLPEFPRFNGSLGDLSAALCPDLPYCHKFMMALTLVGGALSGKVHLDDAPYLDPRFYTALIDEKGAGKGASWKEVRAAIAGLCGDLYIKNSVDSGPALVTHLAFEPRTLLFSDELSALFEKAKSTGSSKNTLFSELLTLYDGHETENDAKSNLGLSSEIRSKICERSSIKVTNAHLCMLGLVQPPVFQTMWGGTKGGSSGLQSRLVLASSGQLSVNDPQALSDTEKVTAAVDRIKSQIARYLTEDSHIQQSHAATIYRSPEIGQRQRDWWKDRMSVFGASSRLPALLSRFAMMLAITNDCDEITPDILDQALAFGEYQILLCAKFMPSDSVSFVQAFEDLIKRMFEKHGADGLTFNECRRYVNPEQKKLLGGYGPFWSAWNNLLRCERVVVIGKTQRSVFYGLQN